MATHSSLQSHKTLVTGGSVTAEAYTAEADRQMQKDATRLASSQRSSVVLPAGAGKTELIARSVLLNSHAGGQQLILTHTHAGVHALKARLQRLRVPPSAYRVHTLDGFALRFTRHYPNLAGTTILEPEEGRDWEVVREGAARALRSRHLRRVLRESYTGLYVDEYQDCGNRQHELVLVLSDELPTRTLGDPLQGIFGFGGIVDWTRDVAPEFPRLEVKEIPWRWLMANPELGERLKQIRQCLIEGRMFHLNTLDGLFWYPVCPENQVTACYEAAKADKDIVALNRWPNQCHSLAKKLGGSFSSMEELAGKELLRTATALDKADGAERAAALLEFAKRCMTRLPSGIGAALDLFRAGKQPRITQGRRNREVYISLCHVADQACPSHILGAMDAIEAIPEAFIHRRECWYEMKRAFRICQEEPGVESLRAAVLKVRERTRHLGRVAERRVISRPLLVKGLEYDHAIVLDADQLEDARELYVALTRGRSRLTVLSSNPRFQRPAVAID